MVSHISCISVSKDSDGVVFARMGVKMEIGTLYERAAVVVYRNNHGKAGKAADLVEIFPTKPPDKNPEIPEDLLRRVKKSAEEEIKRFARSKSGFRVRAVDVTRKSVTILAYAPDSVVVRAKAKFSAISGKRKLEVFPKAFYNELGEKPEPSIPNPLFGEMGRMAYSILFKEERDVS